MCSAYTVFNLPQWVYNEILFQLNKLSPSVFTVSDFAYQLDPQGQVTKVYIEVWGIWFDDCNQTL